MSAPVRRTGGRSAAVLSSIRYAVEELVRERGAEKVTIPMVAERAGVNPTSIYRRWGDAASLLNDIATYRLDPNRPLPSNGDLRADLVEWTSELVAHYSKPMNAAILRGGAASAGQRETDCLRDRRAEALLMVERAGENSPVSTDEVIDHLIAPIVYRAIFLPWTLDEATATRLVDRLLPTDRSV